MKDAGIKAGRALVLGSDSRSFLAVIRSLGRRNIQVHVICPDPDSPALRSRYISKHHVLPEYAAHPTTWIEGLDKLLRRESFDLVLPCDDPHIIKLTAYQALGKSNSRLELLPADLRELTSSKQRCHDLASSLGVSVARSRLVESRQQLETAILELHPPYVLKPLSSFGADDPITRREVRKAFTPDEAFSIGTLLLETSGLQLQENFIGTGTGVEFLASRGTILTAFQHLRLHEPLHGGGSSYRQGIPIDPRMYRATAAIVAAICYDGVGMVEFKWNRTTDEFVFIELNARFWGSLPLAVASGADFPWFLYQYRCHCERSFARHFRLGLCCRNWTMDFHWVGSNALHDRHNPMLATKPWSVVLRELRSVLRGTERIDTLTHDDPQPFLAELRNAARALARRFWRHCRACVWLRRHRARGIRRRIRHAGRIEFVCFGNICRSPFAEALAAQLHADGILHAAVSSSGFCALEDRQSPAMAVSVAREFGIDLSQHRSRRISADRVARADVIFVFDWANFDSLVAEFPQAETKTFLIGELDSDPSLAVPDPWNTSREMFRPVYRRLTAIVRGGL